MEQVYPLTPIANKVLNERYYKKDDNGKATEDWPDVCDRIVAHVCSKENKEFKETVCSALLGTKFLPNSPCIVNAGNNIGGLLACFVTKAVEDSWVSMCENLATFGHIARRGGGCGVDFSKIRPEGAPVFGSTHAKACGPIQHMRVVAEAMSSITQAGFRGMANMGVLRVNHPDVMKFIVCKQRTNALRCLLKEDIGRHFEQMEGHTSEETNVILDKFISNFNISICATDDFMRRVEKDQDMDLVFEDKVFETVKARSIFELIVENAWKNGDPGLLFYGSMNNGPYKLSEQELAATNPCGEQMLPSWGSCNLGSIDVSKFYYMETENMNWVELREIIRMAVQFLDNVISINKFPTKDFEKWAKENRPVGLGIMGWADLLLKMKLVYGSPESIKFAKKLAKFFADESHAKSVELGKERGTPKACKYDELENRRNVTTISIAPTGSISLIAGCSSSIEPIFSASVTRTDNTGEYQMDHPDAETDYFRCAVGGEKKNAVNWEDHVDMQASFQQYCDSGISKTINMENNATREDVAAAYMRAWKSKCKGITVYRDGCKTTQILNDNSKKGVVGYNNALRRPKELSCDIFKTSAAGFNWHIIIGTLNSTPYELFAVNGSVELPTEGAKVVKKGKRYYSLLTHDNEVLIENLAEEEDKIDPQICLETRRFSLELRHQIHPKYICQQIDKSNDLVTSFSKAVNRIMKNKYLSASDIMTDVVCEKCAKKGKIVEMYPESACWRCPACNSSRCG